MGYCSADLNPTDGKCDSGTTLSFRMMGAWNPKLLGANVSPLSWAVYTSGSDLYAIDGIINNLKPLPALEGVNLTIININFESLMVNS